MRAVEHDPAVARCGLPADRGVERQRVAAPGSDEREGQVGLIYVARADRLEQVVEGLDVTAGRELRLERADRSLARWALSGQPVGDRIRGYFLPALERTEPDQRPTGSRPARGQRLEPRLEHEPDLVGDRASKRPPLVGERFDPGQRGRYFLRPPGDDDLDRIAIEPRRARPFAAGVVEQDEGRDHRFRL